MSSYNIYEDISKRTQGDIYIGVVGPVRTGKSTFIKHFMDLLVIPNIENDFIKERSKDELPQSAAGKTIMTTEPKFVPNEAVELNIEDNIKFRMRMIDCVGYLIPGVLGHLDENDTPRMINTPWNEEKIPFSQAAEIGTQKVIKEHSTVGIVVLSDGSITDLPRENYLEAENRIIKELKNLGKPFIILLNTTHPYDSETEELRDEILDTHNVPVIALNLAQLKLDDINLILEKLLYEFPVREIKIDLPRWIESLDINHWLKQDLINLVKNNFDNILKLREIKPCIDNLNDNNLIKKAFLENVLLGEGTANVDVNLDNDLFFKILSETTGMEITGEHELISMMKILSEAKFEYDKIKFALEEVKRKGYGIVTPDTAEMTLDSPVIIKHGSKFGVKFKAKAPSIHMIRADIETEIAPIVGSQQQSEELIANLNLDMSNNPDKIWELNMFGKSMSDLIKDGLQSKLYNIPEDAQLKLQETLQKILNEGSGGLICIIL
ncbi:MAG: stage IV sporulation protein A [Clostridiales bacterium]|jgi:stage IV sporulation protein A|nr:stage IV sporulation protein A [Clostridiales bacterium]